MRIQLEDNRTPLNEFIDSLGALRKPVELVRGGEVVATVATNGKNAPSKKSAPSRNAVDANEARKDKAARELGKFLATARAQTARLGLTNKQIEKMVDKAVREVRSGHAQRSR
jgi:hypothetical protein